MLKRRFFWFSELRARIFLKSDIICDNSTDSSLSWAGKAGMRCTFHREVYPDDLHTCKPVFVQTGFCFEFLILLPILPWKDVWLETACPSSWDNCKYIIYCAYLVNCAYATTNRRSLSVGRSESAGARKSLALFSDTDIYGQTGLSSKGNLAVNRRGEDDACRSAVICPYNLFT